MILVPCKVVKIMAGKSATRNSQLFQDNYLKNRLDRSYCPSGIVLCRSLGHNNLGHTSWI